MTSTIQFRSRAFCTFRSLPGSCLGPIIRLFDDASPKSDERVTDRSEKEIVDWFIGMRPAREILLDELGLPADTYIQTNVAEPLLERNRREPPGDIDLILVPDPRQAIAIQVKRIRVLADTTHRDRTPGRQLGNVTRLVEQANGSRKIGFCANYALVLIECDGTQRSEYNFLLRDTSPDVFRRIYHLAKDQPIHPDVGLIFVEITQPTNASVDYAAVVAVCEDKRATRLDQPPELSARVRGLLAHKPSM